MKKIKGEAKADLIHVKETLHAVPNKGVGYNILAFVEGTPETNFQTDRAPMVIFNYLGDVSGEGEKGGPLKYYTRRVLVDDLYWYKTKTEQLIDNLIAVGKVCGGKI